MLICKSLWVSSLGLSQRVEHVARCILSMGAAASRVMWCSARCETRYRSLCCFSTALAAGVTAASVALADAGVEMYDLVVGCALVSTECIIRCTLVSVECITRCTLVSVECITRCALVSVECIFRCTLVSVECIFRCALVSVECIFRCALVSVECIMRCALVSVECIFRCTLVSVECIFRCTLVSVECIFRCALVSVECIIRCTLVSIECITENEPLGCCVVTSRHMRRLPCSCAGQLATKSRRVTSAGTHLD